MQWPPSDYLSWKMAEHSAWYSGNPDILADFYSYHCDTNPLNLLNSLQSNSELFWARQLKNCSGLYAHVPIAGDIAETSADLLFSESPAIKIQQAHELKAPKSFLDSQEDLDIMLDEVGFFKRIIEGAETCSAIGGVYIKIAWDEEVSPYPIPVVVQADRVIPHFKFGILTSVSFWIDVKVDKVHNNSKVYRLIETYEKGSIINKLYLGSPSNLGFEIPLETLTETQDLEPIKTLPVDELLAVYIPNMLPNKIDRSSYMGRSDLLGVESLMDMLDDTFTAWLKEIVVTQAKVLVPESYLNKVGNEFKYNVDNMLYGKLDIDPTMEGNKVTVVQFAIRAEQYEKTALNLVERIISNAGYSPQSFGLSIQGRAESGTALNIRERKSFSTKSKKENYWYGALKKIINNLILVYNIEFGGNIDVDSKIGIEFSDSFANDITTTSNAIKMIGDAHAASIETKVRMLHPDWEEEQILKETEQIKKENSIVSMPNPDNPDIFELDLDKDDKEDEV